jgi:monofunctional biosynthetic peptidoglycan transglycosylase
MKTLVRWLVGAAALGFGCIVYAYVTLPDVRPLVSKNPESTAFMELREQQAHLAGKDSRHLQKWVPYSHISPHLKRAVLVAEDAAFWDHDGVDYKELQKSIELDWARGQLVRGASTITQQLAKNLYLSPSRNPLRKLRELIIARRLEAELRKARIFEIYLNVIEWGDGIYGVEAAARAYFGTSASALGAADSALLAGAIINPRVLNPSHPTPRLLARQQIILSRMNVVTPPPDNSVDHLDRSSEKQSQETVEDPPGTEPQRAESDDHPPRDDPDDPPPEPPLDPLPSEPIPAIQPSSAVRPFP